MARAAPLRRRPMRGGHARRRGKPRLFLSAPLGSWVLFSEAAPRPRPASAPLRPPTPLPLFLSSARSRFLFSALLHGLSLPSFFSSFSSSYRFRPPLLLLSFSFSSSAPVSWHCREKRNTGKEEKMEEKAPGPALSKINCSPRGRSIRLKEAAGAGAFRALRKAKPPRRVGRPSPSLGGGAA